jgi:hypothetical protein
LGAAGELFAGYHPEIRAVHRVRAFDGRDVFSVKVRSSDGTTPAASAYGPLLRTPAPWTNDTPSSVSRRCKTIYPALLHERPLGSGTDRSPGTHDTSASRAGSRAQWAGGRPPGKIAGREGSISGRCAHPVNKRVGFR